MYMLIKSCKHKNVSWQQIASPPRFVMHNMISTFLQLMQLTFMLDCPLLDLLPRGKYSGQRRVGSQVDFIVF